jgi:hypothetical protein
MYGVQLLKIENYEVPKGTLYMPHPGSHFPWVQQEYDARGRPTKWEWGGKKEIIRYDQQVLMIGSTLTTFWKDYKSIYKQQYLTHEFCKAKACSELNYHFWWK